MHIPYIFFTPVGLEGPCQKNYLRLYKIRISVSERPAVWFEHLISFSGI